jgi:hypothetical protein
VTWRAGYVFSGHLTLNGDRVLSTSNAADLTMAAELSSRSALILSGGISQGGTAFQLSSKPAEAGQPGFRERTNPALVIATLSEVYALEATPQLRLGQTLAGSLIAPDDALGDYSASVTGSLALSHEARNDFGGRARDAFGAELSSSAAVLRPTTTPIEPYWSIRNSLVARWNHDFSPNWNGQATGGVQQVLTFTGSYPLAILPTGAATLQYTGRRAGAGLTASYGAAADLQTGTVSLTQGVVLHGLVTFDTAYPLNLGASAGIVHAQPLGQAASRVAAGTGNAAQADVGLLWGLSDAVLATARYSIAYQFAQPNGLPPMLTHVALVGLTVRYSNARRVPPAPTLGERVDGSDRGGFGGIGGAARP